MTGISTPNYILNKAQLVDYIAQGSKPIDQWTIGTEHEKFVFQIPELIRAPYEGQRGIGALLHAFESDGWKAINEHGHTIALRQNNAYITLEPAGQFELSGAKQNTLHEMLHELLMYHQQLYKNCGRLGLALLSHGLDPKTTREQMPWMPKQRYKIMRNYMPKVGQLGLDMMTATATVQVNLDYGSETDLAKKLRVGMAVQPIATALFANSPIHKGKLSGYKSYRAHIWTDTDADRSGLLRFAFDEEFTFEKYVDYVLDVPMYFVRRNHHYEDHAGHSFRDFLQGNLPGRKGEIPLLQDFEDHLTTAFPEVRIKTYMEMRGADGGPLPHIEALSAFWTGLLYDPGTLDEVYTFVKTWSFEEVSELLENAARFGPDCMFRGSPLVKTAQELLKLSHQGLKNRNKLDSLGRNETIYLAYLDQLIGEKKCPADDLIKEFTQDCQRNVDLFLQTHLQQESMPLLFNCG